MDTLSDDDVDDDDILFSRIKKLLNEYLKCIFIYEIIGPFLNVIVE